MLESESDPSMPILNLFVTVGYIGARNTNVSAADLLAGGLAWCISATKAVGPEFELLSNQDFVLKEDKVKVGKIIEAALRSMGCPCSLQAHQIQDLDYSGVYPVVQWIVNRVLAMQEATKDELMALEKQESDSRSYSDKKISDLQADVTELEKTISSREKSKNSSDDFEHSLHDPLEKLNSAKRELASKLRAVTLLKRRLDDVPSQSELIQYERRFSELYVQIQEKLQQTRKFYATYNALLEIKELELKETSLLNSISSQFQDAMASTSGRMKLIDSMEGIVQGTKQKLGKVQLGLQAEQKVYDALKEKYAASIAEQRHCSSLLKAFQEEYAKNEMLRRQTST